MSIHLRAGLFFQLFLLNSRRNKLKVFAKLKDFSLNSSRFLPKIKIFYINNKDLFGKLKEFSAKLMEFAVKLKIWAKKFASVVSRTLKNKPALISSNLPRQPSRSSLSPTNANSRSASRGFDSGPYSTTTPLKTNTSPAKRRDSHSRKEISFT